MAENDFTEQHVNAGSEIRIGPANVEPSAELLNHIRHRLRDLEYVKETYLFQMADAEGARPAIGLWMPGAERQADEAAGALARGMRPLTGPTGIDIVCLTEELIPLVRECCRPLFMSWP